MFMFKLEYYFNYCFNFCAFIKQEQILKNKMVPYGCWSCAYPSNVGLQFYLLHIKSATRTVKVMRKLN